MNNPVIIQIVGVLLILFFFFVLYMCSKTWRITHILFAFFTFAAALTLLAFASLSLKTRAAWQARANQLEEQFEQLEDETTELLHGNLDEVRQQQESLRSVRGKWERTMLDRGRVWRNATPAQANNTEIVVSTVPPGVAEADAAPNRIAEGQLLHVFRELELPTSAIKVPAIYLGEFRVSAASDTSVTLTPSFHLGQVDDAEAKNAFSKYQINLLSNNNNATWALYETMPIDAHTAFSLDPTSHPDLKAPGARAFGELDEAGIQEVFQTVAQQATPYGLQLPPDFPQIIQEYLRDGGRADETNDAPENVYLKVRFKKPHSEEVDSDVAQGAISGGYFDSRGRAVVDRLRRGGEPAEFQIDDVGVFERQRAQELVDAGIVEPIEPVYVRPLHDFEFSFHSIFSHLVDLRTKIAGVQRNTDAVKSSIAKLESKIAYHQKERTQLEEDLAKHQYELAEISKLAEQMRQQKQQMQSEMSALYQANNQLSQQLAYIHQQVIEKVSREEAQAATAAVDGEE